MIQTTQPVTETPAPEDVKRARLFLDASARTKAGMPESYLRAPDLADDHTKSTLLMAAQVHATLAHAEATRALAAEISATREAIERLAARRPWWQRLLGR